MAMDSGELPRPLFVAAVHRGADWRSILANHRVHGLARPRSSRPMARSRSSTSWLRR